MVQRKPQEVQEDIDAVKLKLAQELKFCQTAYSYHEYVEVVELQERLMELKIEQWEVMNDR